MQEPNIKDAIKFIAENPKPIKTSELEKLVGEHVFAFSEPTTTGAFVGSPSVEHFFLENGILSKIIPTFHPNVIEALYLKNLKRDEYTKGWLGWKLANSEKIPNSTVVGSYTVHTRAVYLDGDYYSVHAGQMHGDECKYCRILDANDWIKGHKEGSDGYKLFELGGVEKTAVKNVLKKYPKELKKFFGDKIIEELAKKNKIKLD
jgi:hypothetical protein